MQTDPLTRLATWIDAYSTQAGFSRRLKCSESHLSNILSGKKRASLDLIESIVRETGGAVTANDLLSVEAQKLIEDAARTDADAAPEPAGAAP